MGKDIILTGIRSNADLTLGNYLGALLPMVHLQRQKSSDYQINFFVPDLHSFTTDVDHATLYNKTIENLRVFAAAGLDYTNENTYIYRQSYVPAHSELFAILNNFAYFGELSRMTQFKEKAQQIITDDPDTLSDLIDDIASDQEVVTPKNAKTISSGLLTYPVLMAADILLHGAKYVPVGDDQKQHLELCRDLGTRFNNKFGAILTLPLAWKDQVAFYERDNGVRVRSLRNPEKKMSKSVSDPAGTILLTDSPQEASKKVMSATTDSLGEIKFDFKERPGITNLLQILALLTNVPQSSVNDEWEGKSAYGDLKKAVASAVEKFLTEFQAAHSKIDDTVIMKKLETSESYMRESTADTLLKVQQAVGLRPK